MSWFLAFAGFAVLIILHEAGHFVAAKAVGMRVERFSLFFGRTPLRFRRGETEYGIGWIPLGGFVKISGMNPDEELPEAVRDRAYHAQKVWKRIVVIAAGPAVNILLALVLMFVFFSAIGVEGVTDRIGAVERGFPAAGQLEPGDRLVAVDGRRGSPRTLSDAIARHRCEGPQREGCIAASPAMITVERDGRPLTVSLRPIYDTSVRRARVGFGYAAGPRETLPTGRALELTFSQFWFVTKETAKVPAKVFDAEERRDIGGVVGGYEVTRQTILNDLAEVVGVLALISLSLALINLFPFLPLDGGHIFWALVEKVRGKPVPLRVMERAGIVGFMLVLVLFSIGLTNDIGRLTGEGFNVR